MGRRRTGCPAQPRESPTPPCREAEVGAGRSHPHRAPITTCDDQVWRPRMGGMGDVVGSSPTSSTPRATCPGAAPDWGGSRSVIRATGGGCSTGPGGRRGRHRPGHGFRPRRLRGERLEDYGRPEIAGTLGGRQPTGPDAHCREPSDRGAWSHRARHGGAVTSVPRRDVSLASSRALVSRVGPRRSRRRRPRPPQPGS